MTAARIPSHARGRLIQAPSVEGRAEGFAALVLEPVSMLRDSLVQALRQDLQCRRVDVADRCSHLRALVETERPEVVVLDPASVNGELSSILESAPTLLRSRLLDRSDPRLPPGGGRRVPAQSRRPAMLSARRPRCRRRAAGVTVGGASGAHRVPAPLAVQTSASPAVGAGVEHSLARRAGVFHRRHRSRVVPSDPDRQVAFPARLHEARRTQPASCGGRCAATAPPS